MHFFVSPGADEDDLHGSVDRIVYGPLQPIGGAVSAEHGIGVDKKQWLPLSRTAPEIAAMRRLKQAFDPLGILNPGK
ncbi:FAD-linked oxidase C-terminal domain-containing protein, partial [Acinetobacter baumannii]